MRQQELKEVSFLLPNVSELLAENPLVLDGNLKYNI
jgi:hypothetical protein